MLNSNLIIFLRFKKSLPIYSEKSWKRDVIAYIKWLNMLISPWAILFFCLYVCLLVENDTLLAYVGHFFYVGGYLGQTYARFLIKPEVADRFRRFLQENTRWPNSKSCTILKWIWQKLRAWECLIRNELNGRHDVIKLNLFLPYSKITMAIPVMNINRNNLLLKNFAWPFTTLQQ